METLRPEGNDPPLDYYPAWSTPVCVCVSIPLGPIYPKAYPRHTQHPLLEYPPHPLTEYPQYPQYLQDIHIITIALVVLEDRMLYQQVRPAGSARK